MYFGQSELGRFGRNASPSAWLRRPYWPIPISARERSFRRIQPVMLGIQTAIKTTRIAIVIPSSRSVKPFAPRLRNLNDDLLTANFQCHLLFHDCDLGQPKRYRTPAHFYYLDFDTVVAFPMHPELAFRGRAPSSERLSCLEPAKL